MYADFINYSKSDLKITCIMRLLVYRHTRLHEDYSLLGEQTQLAKHEKATNKNDCSPLATNIRNLHTQLTQKGSSKLFQWLVFAMSHLGAL